MNISPSSIALIVLGILVVVWLSWRLQLRLELSSAKHRSLAGHARWSRRFAKLLPFYEFDESQFFIADDAPRRAA
jgi:glutamate-1-semialdehyde 2,1-aminomutase